MKTFLEKNKYHEPPASSTSARKSVTATTVEPLAWSALRNGHIFVNMSRKSNRRSICSLLSFSSFGAMLKSHCTPSNSQVSVAGNSGLQFASVAFAWRWIACEALEKHLRQIVLSKHGSYIWLSHSEFGDFLGTKPRYCTSYVMMTQCEIDIWSRTMAEKTGTYSLFGL